MLEPERNVLEPAESFGQIFVVSKISKVDDFFQLDKYQLLMLLFNELMIFNILSNQVFNVFAVAPPTVVGCNGIPYNGTQLQRCAQFKEDTSCITPELSYKFESTEVEFSQFCGMHERTWLDDIVLYFGVSSKTKFSTTIQMIGLMIGAGAAGHLSDNYGRKKVLMFSLSTLCFFSTVLSFAPNIDMYVICRFFIGLFIGSLTTVGPIFVLECLPIKHRLWIATVVTWGPNFMILAAIGFLTQEWRLLSRTCNAISVLGIFVLGFWLEESPKYSIQHKHRENAISSLQRINSWKQKKDRVTLRDIETIVDKEIGHSGDTLLDSKKPISKKYSFIDLYRTKDHAVKTGVTSFGLFSVSVVSYALLFNLHVIPGSLYLNMAASGALRWGIGAIVAIVDHFGGKKVGRKIVHAVTLGAVTACLVVLFLITINGLKSTWPLAVQICTLTCFGITGCIFLQMALAVAEQFPTAIRNLANANANVCGRLGSTIGPLLFSLNDTLKGGPYLLLAIISALDLLFFQIFLAETKGAPLPDQMPAKKEKQSADA